jgi:hypothetical protein
MAVGNSGRAMKEMGAEQWTNVGTAPKREVAADNALRQAAMLAEVAHGIAQRAHSQLERVMVSPVPMAPVPNEIKGGEVPPYFDELRSHLRAIDSALESIKDALDRTEI